MTSFLRELVADRRQKAMLGLGFSQGIPYLLVFKTQSAWLTDAKVPLETLGFLSELTLAYRFKFLWAPFLERYDAPVLGRLLGRRRGWMVLSQLFVMLALAGIAFGDPATRLWWTAVVSVALGFAGATQDVVVDGWRIASVPVERQPLMTTIAESGYRIGIFVSGAGALILSDRIGWNGAYLVMVAAMLPGIVAALYAPEPEFVPSPLPEQAGLVATILGPFLELFKRLGPMALPILVMIAGFRMPGYVSDAMSTPLFKSLHYSNTDIATVTKLFGFWVALAGVPAAGFFVTRVGMMASLAVGTIVGSASHLALAYLAAHGGPGNGSGAFWSFAIAAAIDGFSASFAQIVLITYMSSIASAAYAGSQFGMLTLACRAAGQPAGDGLRHCRIAPRLSVVLHHDVADRPAGGDPHALGLARRRRTRALGCAPRRPGRGRQLGMSCRLDAGLEDLAPAYDLILCDVWGVVHNGIAHHPAAVDALQRFRAGGGTVVLVTNAPAPASQVLRRLDKLAVPRDAYDAIATSGDVTIAMIVAAGCPPLFSIGPGGEYAIYTEAARQGPRPPPLVPIEQAELAICIGLDETGERPEDYDASLAALRARNLDLVCANPDIVVEVGDTLVYCAGAIAERYAAIGGTVIQAGKPYPAIYERALKLAADAGCVADAARVLAIGDATHTDIAGAARMGFASVLITSGIHRARLHVGERGSSIDEAALRQFLDETDARPSVVLPKLTWRG